MAGPGGGLFRSRSSVLLLVASVWMVAHGSTTQDIEVAEPNAPAVQPQKNSTSVEIQAVSPAVAKERATKKAAKAGAAELKKEKQEKVAARTKLARASAATEAAVAAVKAAKTEGAKKKALKAEKLAKQQEAKAQASMQRLDAQGRRLKAKAEKAEAALRRAAAQKETLNKAVKLAKQSQEKRTKNDKWYRKGHLLFAQGIKYQGLLEKLSKATNKLDAYHYQAELETFSKALPKGFTAALKQGDGYLGAETADRPRP